MNQFCESMCISDRKKILTSIYVTVVIIDLFWLSKVQLKLLPRKLLAHTSYHIGLFTYWGKLFKYDNLYLLVLL